MTDQIADLGRALVDEDYDRREFMFRPGAPDVGIGGIDVFRSTIAYLGDDLSDVTDQNLSWVITGVKSDDSGHPFMLIGDLNCTGEGWLVAATVVSHISFRDGVDPHLDSPEELKEAVEILGAWASSVLYDTAAGSARSMMASNLGCRLHIPVLTPKARFGRATVVPQTLPE